MAQLTLNLSGKLGLNNYTSSQGGRNDYVAKDGQISGGLMNPFIRYGYASPATQTSTNVTLDNTQNSNFNCTHYDAINDNIYLGEYGQLFKGASATATSLTRVLVTPGGNADIIRDIDIYMVNGVRKIFVVYQTAANKCNICISSLPYNSGADDKTWLTATVTGQFTNALTGDAWLQVSDNGFAYLLMENQVHKIDGSLVGGTNGTIYPNALLFPVSYRMVDSMEAHGLMFIAIHNYNTDTRNTTVPALTGPLNVGIYVWDRQTTVFGVTDYIPLNGFTIINKLFLSPTGKIRVLATDNFGRTQLLEYDGSAFFPVITIGQNSRPLFRDSFTTFGELNTWFGQDGILYFYGSLAPKDTEGLYRLFADTSISSTSGGIVLVSNGYQNTPAIYITYQIGGGTLKNIRHLIYTSTGQTGGTTADGTPLVFPVKYLPVYSAVNFLKIPCIPTVDADPAVKIAQIDVYINQNTNIFTSKNVFQRDANSGMIDVPINKVGVWSIQLVVTWSANTVGTDDFAFNAGYLDYEPIIKRK